MRGSLHKLFVSQVEFFQHFLDIILYDAFSRYLI